MRIPRIYCAQRLQEGSNVVIDKAASHYLAKVLRLQPGRGLTLFNGDGYQYSAVITCVNKKSVETSVDTKHHITTESPLQTELAIGISRGERMDWVLQKATELGVSSLVPLITERTEVKLNPERTAKKMRHWQQITISACEQCGRNVLPQLQPPKTLASYIEMASADVKFVLAANKQADATNREVPASVALLIGPEGGLCEQEIELANAGGFQGLSLGARVLRTETAPLAALTIVQYRWGDMGDA